MAKVRRQTIRPSSPKNSKIARALPAGRNKRRRVCFVTGTRAEFGLMESTLRAIAANPRLNLQIIATGMHLSAGHGNSLQSIRAAGWKVDASVPWPTSDQKQNAVQTGRAMAEIALALDRLSTEIVLVVGDRVEAFAAAAAGHISGRIVAHVHGGDRALGQVDDSLRHAVTKLAHLHFPATAASRKRILQLGEDRWRIHRAGSPGIDGIVRQARAPNPALGQCALVVLHPTGTDESLEFQRASLVLRCVRSIAWDNIVIVYPNNDPGNAGIVRCWAEAGGKAIVLRNLPRVDFLTLMRDAVLLAGNSSSGIIEAASFGTPVVDIGSRQLGREHSANLVNVPFVASRIQWELRRIWNNGKPIRYPKHNVYGGNDTGRRIADVLSTVSIDSRWMQKLIAY